MTRFIQDWKYVSTLSFTIHEVNFKVGITFGRKIAPRFVVRLEYLSPKKLGME